jgi:alkylation response protein AidB-like acyl-CoA dehydrogenase
MPCNEDEMVRDSMRGFRSRRIESQWDRLDAPDAARHDALWEELRELGVTLLGLPPIEGGGEIDARSQFDVLCELGAGSPALAFSLVSHLTALRLLSEASHGALPAPVADRAAHSRFALAGSVLDRRPDTPFVLRSNGAVSVVGRARVGLARPDFLVVPAIEGKALRLVVLRGDEDGVRFAGTRSSHGLCLVPFGDLTIDCHTVSWDCVLPWPSSGRAVRMADGLVTAILCGMARELAERAMGYALQRRQGGKPIHEHDAVRDLTGPIELARRTLETLSIAVLSGECPGDGGASAFGVDLVRQSGLDAVQTFGGYGYMEDYRVERYLRDANTLETCCIHASARRRDIACARFAQMAG